MHFLRIHLVGKRIATATAIDDPNVFGKVGTTGDAVAAALKGQKVRFSVASTVSYSHMTRSYLQGAKESTFGKRSRDCCSFHVLMRLG